MWKDLGLMMMSGPRGSGAERLVTEPELLTARVRLRNQMRLIVIYRLDVQRPHYPS